MKKKSPNTDKVIIPVVTILLLFLVWEAVVRIFQVPEYTIPAPSRIWQTVIRQMPLIMYHSGVTLYTALLGFVLAVVISLILGLVMDAVEPVRKALYPLMVISQTIPLIFIYPLLMMWLGFGILPRVLVVIIVCVFPVTVNLVDGLTQVDPEMVDLFRSMKASSRQIFFYLKWPGALVPFFSGLKVSATYCIMGAVIGEWMGAGKGIGIYMLRSYKTFAYSQVYASIFVAIFLSLLLFGMILILERLFLSWEYKRKGVNGK